MIQIAIVEDDPAEARNLESYIRRYGEEKGQAFRVFTYSSGAALLERYDTRLDLILMDIEMPGMDGMETAHRLRELDEGVVLVFITNMAQYAIRGYAVGALDYILKPVSYYAFQIRFSRALGRVDRSRREGLVLSCPEGEVWVEIRRIQYVEVQNRVLRYHTEEEVYALRGTLKEAEERLAGRHFVRGNYWYLVHLLHVKRIGAKTVEVAGAELPLSRGCRPALLAAFSDYIGGVERR